MLNIILVDDEPIILQGLTKLITELGEQFHVMDCYRNGQEALAFMKVEQVDVVITDIKMPLMDGLELIKEVLLVKPDMSCIILSGFADFEYARTAMRYGAAEYLIKPVDPVELHSTLYQIELSKRCLMLPDSIEKDEKVEKRVIEEIKKHLLAHYREELDLQKLSEKVHLNPSYISRLFKNETKESITAYLIHIRIEKSKQLLVQQLEMKIYEVAEHVGYNDAMYFNKLFKKITNLTPKEYRDYHR